MQRLFGRSDFRRLLEVMSKGRSERFGTVVDYDRSTSLAKAQFVPTEMYGQPRYRRKPDARIADFTVWTGLSFGVFVAAETPELDGALADCKVLRRISFETDGRGFKKTEPAPEAGAPSVLFLGDSFTEGLHMASADTFVSLYGRKMREAGLWGGTLNGGVDGYGTLEEAWTAENFAVAVNAKLVVENLFLNDAGDQAEVVQNRVSKDGYKGMFSYLDRLARFCEISQIALVVAVIPAKEQMGEASLTAFQRRVHQWCRQRGIRFLNALPEFAARGGTQNYLSWDPHLNQEGHRNYAAFLFEQTLPLLKERFPSR
jgi:lysophospholipase L1-like esterase